MEGGDGEVIYGECMRNHAVGIGLFATDGCGEFILDRRNPRTMICDACKCHRSYHRRISLPSPAEPGGTLRIAEQKPKEPKKFTIKQEEKMVRFADKLGWMVGGKEQEDEINQFCSEIGVSKQSFIAWVLDNDNDNYAGSSDCCPSAVNSEPSVNKM